MKVKKRTKSSRYRGRHSHGRGFKKKARGSGHRGGVGMAGTGKRADQKKTLVINLYGNDYFGKDKTLRRGNSPAKLKSINIKDIETNLQSFIKKGMAKLGKDKNYELNLENYKLLGDGELKTKLTIKASAASQSAINKVRKSGGEIIVSFSETKITDAKTKAKKAK